MGDPRSDSSHALAAGLVSDQVLGHPNRSQRVCGLLRAFPDAPPLPRPPTTASASHQLADALSSQSHHTSFRRGLPAVETRETGA